MFFKRKNKSQKKGANPKKRKLLFVKKEDKKTTEFRRQERNARIPEIARKSVLITSN